MRNNPFNRLLRNEAHELGDGGGAAPAAAAPAAVTPPPAAPPAATAPPVAAPAAAAPPPVAPPAAAAPPREPTMLEKVQGAIRDKGVILAENSDLKNQLATLKGTVTERDGTIATLNARVTALETENGLLKQDFQSIDAALKTTEAKVVSIDAAAAKQVSKMGFEPGTLPAAETAAPTVEGLVAKMNATTDPEEKFKLAAQINKMEAGN